MVGKIIKNVNLTHDEEEMIKEKERLAGILMHITSLPSIYGIGDMGDCSRSFIDFLAESGMSMWQILPLGPTGYGDSPYAPRSSFAGNELLISLEPLLNQGLLDEDEAKLTEGFSQTKTEYGKVISTKIPLLLKAASRFISSGAEKQEFENFCKTNSFWLDDYCLFMVISRSFNDQRWNSAWPLDLGIRKAEALKEYSQKHSDEILQWAVLQYWFDTQWKQIKKYANSKKIRIIGDIPIFVAPDSADAWAQIDLLKADSMGHFTAFSGVPPDIFSTKGQFWGNPVYDWDRNKATGYRWWKQRIARQLELCDILRIDHFRGFESYWEIPAGKTDAVIGKWEPAPGAAFFREMEESFPQMQIVAEDLGFTTDKVIQMLKETGFPGMKIAQDGYKVTVNGSLDLDNPNLPSNYPYNCIAYPGTHDNDTINGWFLSQNDEIKKLIAKHYNLIDPTDEAGIAICQDILDSNAHYAVIQMQDILGLSSDARMNTPATCSDRNWSWRMKPGILDSDLSMKIHECLNHSGRLEH